jgi:hypothetical protein
MFSSKMKPDTLSPFWRSFLEVTRRALLLYAEWIKQVLQAGAN